MLAAESIFEAIENEATSETKGINDPNQSIIWGESKNCAVTHDLLYPLWFSFIN